MRLLHRFTVFGLILLAVMAIGFACAPASAPSGSTTTSPPGGQDENPEWLTDLVERLKNEPVANPPASIKEYAYNGQTVYYLPPRYADIWSTLYNADGAIIGHPDGGITGQGDGRVQDFLEERKNERVVWADDRVHDLAMVQVPAPIVSVEILIAESFPPQYFLEVVSGLPNSCAKFAGYRIERMGERITVEIVNWKPADPNVACAEVYRTVETSIPLGSDFESDTTYTVDVNGVTKTFTAQ